MIKGVGGQEIKARKFLLGKSAGNHRFSSEIQKLQEVISEGISCLGELTSFRYCKANVLSPRGEIIGTTIPNPPALFRKHPTNSRLRDGDAFEAPSLPFYLL